MITGCYRHGRWAHACLHHVGSRGLPWHRESTRRTNALHGSSSTRSWVCDGSCRNLRDRGPCHLGLHHTWGGTPDTTHRASKARLCLDERGGGDATASRTARTRTRLSRSRLAPSRVLLKRGTLDSHRNNLFTSEEEEAKSSAVLTLFLGHARLGGQAPELLTVAQHQIHVTVEGHELAH